jgi:uncharacterized protein YndB with AHSA1/START domain
MKQEPFIIRRTYDAPVEKVWEAITNKKKMQQWYMDKLEDFKPEPGFTTAFTVENSGKNFVHLWKVTEVIPGKKISYEWRYEGYPGNSLVTFELIPEGAKTTLTLTHSGLETFQPEVYPELARENFQNGWNDLIGTLLKKFVEETHP